MDLIETKFLKLAADNAPGQETRINRIGDSGSVVALKGGELSGVPVDFSHGDVDAFLPSPGAQEAFVAGYASGGRQAYTEYRGGRQTRQDLASKLAAFTGKPIENDDSLILTPGSQGALFLAMASVITAGDKVAIVQPDYFANRKIAQFLEAEITPVRLHYAAQTDRAGLDLDELESAFKSGAKLFVFSNPNNPAGVIYSEDEIGTIASLANRYGVTVIVDQLYSRLLYDGKGYTHLRAAEIDPDKVVTIMGPSKTESLSGYRLGVAFGSLPVIDRMEKLQAIVSLRAAGYNQAVLNAWFSEPAGWMAQRIAQHQAIRDDLVAKLRTINGASVRTPEAGSYLFPTLPTLSVSTLDFAGVLRKEAGVTVTIGTEFGPRHKDSVRLNFSQNHQAAVHAVDRMVQLIQRYR
ncbi:aspartate aminotransferase [Advenella kashmirensis W13003]|uniref:Aspartate aminotransferase n=1 Tax=Advenella kashmirensis W13003 TaxID=1424334 RepID=V8QQI3_9BURK|nr:pyridoxal phosphate-dependent aminotransferase [Advenella kashmirensis]ETF01259.1 aspartate aminotransferase [Advenella kashmirensis W13003]